MKILTSQMSLRLLVASLIGLAFACSKPKEEAVTSPDSTAAPSTENTTEAVKQGESGVKLKGIYTTSTKTPASQFSFDNLFDGDPKTYWATMPNAWPDEGVMLYFQSPQSISHL